MDFNLSEDRRMLSDTLQRYLGDNYDIETRNKLAYTAPYHSPEKWQEMAELGILSALVDEAHGGFGGDGFDISVVFEELGRALCPEPFLANLMCLRLAQSCDDKALIEAITTGQSRAALAVFEPDNYDTLSTLTTSAESSDDSWELTGQKAVVYGAPGADVVLVAAQSAGKLALFKCEAADIKDYAMIDGGGAGEINLSATPATQVAAGATSMLEEALDAGRLALCAEAVGAMDALLAMTVEYLGQRQQFGTTIATFQALQHRVVDMAMEIEQARSITVLAASKLNDGERARYVAMAKNLVGRAATLIGEESTQLHGGIGMTWEYGGSHYAKRLIMLDHQLGDRFQQINKLLAA